MLERILLPLDGSELAECVLPHAVAVAQATGATLILLQVLEPAEGAEAEVAPEPLDWHLRKAAAEAYLAELSERLSQFGLEIERTLLEGDAAEQIVAFVRQEPIDLIVLSSHGESGLSGWNVSSVVQKVILRANTSVLIVRAYLPATTPAGELRYRRILVPLDGSQRAEVVLPIVRQLAQQHGAKALLTSVVVRPEMPRRAPLSAEDARLADKVMERNQEEARRYLEELTGRLEIEVEMHLLTGESLIATLHDFVENEEVDLVIFSAHGYSGNGSRPYGSVVTSFIAYGSTPLLIVQDLPPEEIAKQEAEIAAAQNGASASGQGGHTLVSAPGTE